MRQRLVSALLLAVLVLVGWTGPGAAAHAAGMNLHRGSRGSSVKTLEQRLHTLRLLPRRAVNRFYSRTTVRAVRKFQAGHRLHVTGRVRAADWNAVAAAVAPPSTPSWSAPSWAAPKVVAHRGEGAGSAPENSVAAWTSAVPSADFLDMDVRWTSDHQMLVMHDATLDRTTTCSGEVSARTAADIAAHCRLDDGTAVPTFDQAVSVAAPTGRGIAPEIKPDGLSAQDLEAFVAVLRSHHIDGRTFVQSFIPSYFAPLSALDADLRFVYLQSGSAPPPSQDVQGSKAQVVGAKLGTTDPTDVAAWHQAGLQVWLWTSKDLTGLRETWTLGADAAITDKAVEARDLYGAPR